MNIENRIFSSMTILLSFYLTIVVIYCYFNVESVHNFNNTYFLILCLLLSIISFYFIIRRTILGGCLFPSFSLNISSSHLFIFLIFSSLAVINSTSEFKERPIWLDEYTQFKRVSSERLKDKTIIKIAAHEQQPPLDYYLSSFSFSIWGWKDYAVRIHAVISYFMTFFLLFIFLSERYKNILLLALGMMLFTSSPVLRYYSVEGRPTMLCAMLALLYILNTSFYFSKRIITPLNTWTVFTSIILFSLSIGFQAQVFIFFFSLTYFFFYFKSQPKKSFIFLGLNLLSAILISPVLYTIYQASEQTNQFHSLDTFFGVIKNKLDVIPLLKIYSLGAYYEIKKLFQLLNLSTESIYQLALLPLIISVIAIFFKKSIKRHHATWIIFYFLYPVFMFPIFLATISWYFQEKYYLSFTLFIILLIVEISSLIRIQIPPKLKRSLYYLSLLGIISFSIQAITSRENIMKFHDVHVFSKKLYQRLYIENFTNVAINFNVPKLGEWRGEIWLSKEIYAHPDTILLNTNLYNPNFGNNLYIHFNHLPQDKIFKLHLIQKEFKARNTILKREFLEQFFSEVDYKYFPHHHVYSISLDPKQAQKKWMNFILSYEKTLSPVYRYLFLETYLSEAIMNKDFDKCRQLKKEYLSLDLTAYNDGGFEVDSQKIKELNIAQYPCE